jgi:beta-galactosidase
MTVARLANRLATIACLSTLLWTLPRGSRAEDSAAARDRSRLSLDGTWDFRMDPKNEGESDKWWSAEAKYPDAIQVPGTWQAQGFGQPIGIVKHNYQGHAWYRRAVTVPKEWKGHRIWLRFEGVCNNGEAYLNGQKVGHIETFITPYEFDVTKLVQFDRENVLGVMVDSGSTEAVQRSKVLPFAPESAAGYVGMMQFLGKWGGITSHVLLEARPDPAVDEIVLRPDLAKKEVHATLRLKRHQAGPGWDGRATVRIVPLQDKPREHKAEATIRFKDQAVESEPAAVTVTIPDLRPWSPDDPFLYKVIVETTGLEGASDSVTLRTGFRELGVDVARGDFVLNGKPLFLRGIGYDSLEPITGAPPPDKQVYVDRLRLLKQYGFNYVRFLGHTPLAEFFDAADEVGILVQCEGEWFAGFNSPMSPKAAALLTSQVPRIIREHRHHPSWYAFSCFNEAVGANGDPIKNGYIQAAFKTFRETDPTRLFLASDGGNDQWPTDVISDRAMMDKADAADQPGANPSPADYRARPHVWHEFNNTYFGPLPDLDIEKRLTGVITQEWVLEPHRRRVEAYGLSSRYPEIRQRSFDLYCQYVKWIFENARRMPRLDGYAWWGVIADIPGGVETDVSSLALLDMLYQPEKFAFDEFRKFNRESVLTMDADIDRRVLASGESRTPRISLSHFGEQPVKGGRLLWKITTGPKVLKEGKIEPINAECRKITDLGPIPLGPFECDEPLEVRAQVELISDACHQSNDWKFWVFPAKKKSLVASGVFNAMGEAALDARYGASKARSLAEAKVVLARRMTPDVLKYLQTGGRVIFLTQDAAHGAVHHAGTVGRIAPVDAGSGFLKNPGAATFWPLWIRCNANIVENHPALATFPHHGFADFQLMRLYGDTAPSVDFTPANAIARSKVKPIIWPLYLAPWKEDATRFDTALTRHGLLSECRVEKGKALLCTLWVLDGVKAGLPEAGYLLDCLVDHALSDRFEPEVPPFSAEETRTFFKSE